MNAKHQEPLPGQSRRVYWLHLVALTLAFLATCVSVFMSIGLGLKACPLCFYQRSFAMSVFAVLTTALAAAALSGSGDHRRPLATVGAGGLGLVLAWGSVASSPPLPTAPDVPYDPVEQPLEMCRPPYLGTMEAGAGDS